MDLRHIVPDPTLDDNKPSRRRGSSSSTPSIGSAGPVNDHKRSPRSSKPRRSRPSFSHDLTGAEARDTSLDASSSRRESASSMRTTATIDDPVTYTPTTHRVSKAKKGKRVHICEYPGCNKVFTRAEHRRRHELNHSPEASFPCTRHGCGKAFHRSDLLTRHLERHELEEQAAASGHALNVNRRTAHQHIAPELSPAMPPQHMTGPSMVPSNAHHSNPVAIDSLVHPHHSEHGYGQSYPSLDFSSGAEPTYRIPLGTSSDESNFFYSSPDSCHSPVSEPFQRYNHRNSLSSASSVMDVYAPPAIDPIIGTTLPGWTPVVPANIPTSHSIGEDVSALQSVGNPISVSIPFSDLDGTDWTTLRRELGRCPGVVSDSAGLAIIDPGKLSRCLELFGRYFELLFPVVPLPKPVGSFGASKPPPLLTGVMVGVGSQYDSIPNSKAFAMALLDASSSILNKREHTTGQSRLADLQIIFILEALNRFGSRRVDVESSPRFRFLYASLAQARHWVLTNPLAVLKSLKGNSNSSEIRKAHNFWLDHETRRRILLACFVLDTLQTIMFGQQPVLIQFPGEADSGLAMNDDMPFPCPSALWESGPGRRWSSLATDQVNENISLRDATAMALSSSPKPLDTFQSILVLAQVMTRHRHMDSFSTAVQMFHSNLVAYNAPNHAANPLVEFTYHALLAAYYTPVHDLLVVSGESWLYGKKIEDQAEFRSARQKLRTWVNEGSPELEVSPGASVLKALWHATRLLSLVLGRPSNPVAISQAMVGPYSTSMLPHSVDLSFGDLLSDIQPPLNIPYEPWSIYLCALICWAYGLDSATATTSSMSADSSGFASDSSKTSSSSHPALLSPLTALAEAQTYISMLTSDHFSSPDDLLHLDFDIRGRTDGLLETIRTRRLSSGESGLVSEAEGVLFRLVEKRGRGWAF